MRLFNIQKFCIDDGPGIRTAFFFKGCKAHCPWCANPESQNPNIQPAWDKDLCCGCQTCVQTCPEHALMWNGMVHLSSCSGCGKCAAVCPKKAIHMKGADYDIDKLVSIALEDKEFYEESGGGITLSGGEALLQDVRPFILALKKHGLDVTLETEGQVESSPFSTALLCDHILFDVKSADAKKLASIGIDMDLMMANLKSLAGKDVLIRTPVIPGFNQSEDDIAAIAQLIKRLGFERMQLLPFHQFGEKKYEQLQKPYAYRGKAALSDADLSCLIAAAKKEGVNAF